MCWQEYLFQVHAMILGIAWIARRKKHLLTLEVNHYKQSTLAAMGEARKISRDPNVPSYDNMDELKRALEE